MIKNLDEINKKYQKIREDQKKFRDDNKKKVISRHLYIEDITVEDRISKAGKQFEMLVIYHTKSNDGAEKGTHTTPTFTDQAKYLLTHLKPGNVYSIRMSKENGYWVWTRAVLMSERN